MPPSNVSRVISASLSGLLLEDLVPWMHVMDDQTAARDSLHLSQLMTTGTASVVSRQAYLPVFCRKLWLRVPSPVMEKTRGVKTPPSTSRIR